MRWTAWSMRVAKFVPLPLLVAGVTATAAPAGNAWALGNSTSSSTPFILHWNGSTWRTAPAVMLTTGAAGVPTARMTTGPAAARTVTALRYNSKGWKYKQVRWGAYRDFYKPSFSASRWRTGQEGFGTTDNVCSWNNSAHVKTVWSPNTDMLIRHWISIPRNARNVRIRGSIDNDAHVYLNGHLLQYVQSGSCLAGAIHVTVPRRYLKRHNLLAIRGHDYGLATYLNVQVTYN